MKLMKKVKFQKTKMKSAEEICELLKSYEFETLHTYENEMLVEDMAYVSEDETSENNSSNTELSSTLQYAPTLLKKMRKLSFEEKTEIIAHWVLPEIPESKKENF